MLVLGFEPETLAAAQAGANTKYPEVPQLQASPCAPLVVLLAMWLVTTAELPSPQKGVHRQLWR